MISVVIPNFNGADVLPGCLEALMTQHRPADEVIIVDNGSSDGSAHRARERFPAIRLVETGSNLGFAGGANRGIALARGDRVAVLNSDAAPSPDWLELIDSAPRDPDVWAWGSVLIDSAGVVESAGDCMTPGGAAFKAAQGVDPASLPSEPYDVFAPPGAAPVYRRDVLEELGGYDERYFLYYEDIDLAFRARLRGYRALVVPRARVSHVLAASSRGSDLARYYVARNSWWCLLSNHPTLHPRAIAANTRREWRAAKRDGYRAAFLRGRIASLRGFPRVLTERRRRRASRTAGAQAVESAYGHPAPIRDLGPDWI